MRRFSAISCAMLLGCAASAVAAEGSLRAPESVVNSGEFLFVSNLGAKVEPSVKDGDGYIAKLEPNGAMFEEQFLSGLNAPKGMVLQGKTLYVTDIDRLLAFDIASKQKTLDLDFSSTKTTFLNDIVALDDKTLAVTATDLHKIFIVRLGEMASFTELKLKQPVLGANGLAYDFLRKTLYVVGFGDGKPSGQLFKITLDNDNQVLKQVRVGKLKGHLDGIAMLNPNEALVSDWVAFAPEKGRLLKVDLRNGKTTAVKDKLSGPADFIVTEGKVLLPEMLNNAFTLSTIIKVDKTADK
jgi:hypothetical protein